MLKSLIPVTLALAAASSAAASSLTMTVNKPLVGPGEEVQFIINGRPGDLIVFLASPNLGPIPYPKVGSLDIGAPTYIELIPVPANGVMICIPDNPCFAIGTVPLTMHAQAFSVDLLGVGQPVTGKTGVVSVTYDQSLLQDCNNNASADVCDIQSGFSFDVNTNGIPDECEIDCDQDGIPDGLFPVGGLVWHDVDGNGVADAGEPGVPDVIVTLLDAADQVVAGTMTGPDGRWKVQNVANPAGLRVEFTDVPGWLSEPPAANGAGTEVQYVFGPDCSVDLGLIEPSELCLDATKAELASPCYVNGDPNAGGTSGPLAALVRFNYQATGLDTTANVYLADAQHVGALWGLAYARSTDVLYGATFLKRHSGFGPGGIDAIYEVKDARTAANPAANVSVWLNVNSLPGQNVGTVSRPDLPMNFDQASYEVDAYAKVGKVGLGGIDVSDDDKSLYVVNLNSREVLEIDVATKTLTNAWSAVAGVTATNGEARPFAVEWHRGELYVGVVNTAEGQNGFFTDLEMRIRRLVNGQFQDCLVAPLNYPKGFAYNGCPAFAGWYPWVSFFPAG
ncbi:MAG: SdrD B-like domain-containing protein [Planctomycetota bacterium JB042]